MEPAQRQQRGKMELLRHRRRKAAEKVRYLLQQLEAAEIEFATAALELAEAMQKRSKPDECRRGSD